MVNINIKLSDEGITEALKKIYFYQKQLPLALKEAEERLMYSGIIVARRSMTDFENEVDTKSLITFKQTYNVGVSDCKALLMEIDLQPIVSKWKHGKEIVSADVSPSWMLEFGSGRHAVEGHRGTFTPNYGHAFDDDGWYWRDEDGVLHQSDGFYPTHPMYNAMLEMYSSVFTVFKEVFA